ncbi:MAG: hypothetical protein KatS3mg014_0006 [Actinomycetota bacterium]|nr:MAG: hypothetical protein KatS3mg014_0006 [Actinomycetota bacterium]
MRGPWGAPLFGAVVGHRGRMRGPRGTELHAGRRAGQINRGGGVADLGRTGGTATGAHPGQPRSSALLPALLGLAVAGVIAGHAATYLVVTAGSPGELLAASGHGYLDAAGRLGVAAGLFGVLLLSALAGWGGEPSIDRLGVVPLILRLAGDAGGRLPRAGDRRAVGLGSSGRQGPQGRVAPDRHRVPDRDRGPGCGPPALGASRRGASWAAGWHRGGSVQPRTAPRLPRPYARRCERRQRPLTSWTPRGPPAPHKPILRP